MEHEKIDANETMSKVDYCMISINVMINNKIREKIDDQKHMRTKLDDKKYKDIKNKSLGN